MLFSDHFKRILHLLGASVLLLVGAYFYIKYRIHEYKNPTHIALPASDKELITYNENRHIITVTTSKGTTTAYSRNPSVELRKNGTVKIDKNAWGLEFHPILGLGYQDTRRVYIGIDHFYFHQFDLFTALGFPTSSSYLLLEPMTGIAYNLYSNTSIGIGLNPVNIMLHEKPDFGVVLTVRL